MQLSKELEVQALYNEVEHKMRLEDFRGLGLRTRWRKFMAFYFNINRKVNDVLFDDEVECMLDNPEKYSKNGKRIDQKFNWQKLEIALKEYLAQRHA